MKKYRIIADEFSGYEAQVQYKFLPFVWFQVNYLAGVNTWDTPEEALEFISMKLSGADRHRELTPSILWNGFREGVKGLIGKGISSKIIWQQQYQEFHVEGNQPMIAGMMMVKA